MCVCVCVIMVVVFVQESRKYKPYLLLTVRLPQVLEHKEPIATVPLFITPCTCRTLVACRLSLTFHLSSWCSVLFNVSRSSRQSTECLHCKSFVHHFVPNVRLRNFHLCAVTVPIVISLTVWLDFAKFVFSFSFSPIPSQYTQQHLTSTSVPPSPK